MAVALHNLAAIAHRRGSLAEAREGYARALAVKKQVLGDDHPECAATLINIGRLYRTSGEPERRPRPTAEPSNYCNPT